nr:uncharacterized protein LOC124212924 isoform X3 [Neodiprion pinetum]
MEHARPPPALSSGGAMDENWKDWKRQFLIFLKASGIANKPTDVRANILLNLIGPVGMTVFKNFTFDDPDDEENVEILIEKFEDHFSPRKTEVHERYIFFSSVRQQSETIPHYVQTLKKKASTCNFGGLTESLIRDKIISDVKNKELRKIFLEEKDLSLSRAVEMWEQNESISKLNTAKAFQPLTTDPSTRINKEILIRMTCQDIFTAEFANVSCISWNFRLIILRMSQLIKRIFLKKIQTY